MKIFPLSLVGILSLALASPAGVKHAKLFEPYLKYQQNLFSGYASLIKNGTLDKVARAKLLCEITAKQDQLNAQFGKTSKDYFKKGFVFSSV
jgi:hypothetical protein